MVCFATVLEDGLRFLYVAEGLLLLVALQKAQSEVVVGLGGLLMARAADLEDVDERTLGEGDGVLDLMVAEVVGGEDIVQL